ncbi:MAG TPA: helical backbone metal receptor [Spirochaetota bacterium]|nr:helical backbone metal receptor [Spirochaetota bacterium]HOM10808.1 helical backbone metal receptor [Spirochaetota bacterium]
MHTRNNTVIAITCFVIIWAIAHSMHSQAANKSLQQYTRIVSLSPSITAMIQDLGCEHLLVGVTQYHPPLSRAIPIVGTITNPNSEAIIALQPDIILHSKEDSPTQKIDMLHHAGLRLYALPSADSFETICSNYRTIAGILNIKDYAIHKLSEYKKKRHALIHKINRSALILLSANPFIAVSRHSYISNIFADAGIDNTLYYSKTRYPIVQLEYLLAQKVGMIIVLNNDTLPDTIEKTKNIVHMPYDELYLYTPRHYCDSLQHVVTVLYGK